MYKNRRLKKNTNAPSGGNADKRKALDAIDENATIKLKKRSTDATASQHNVAKSGDEQLEDIFDSEENIPASQEPTQRYLSQRSTIAATLARTQSRNVTQRAPNSYFELALMKAGVLLDDGENFVITCDHVVFVNKFRDIFIKAPNYPENVNIFKTGLREVLSPKSKYAQKLLTGCTVSIEEQESVYQSQDSMMVNFLLIDFLCPHVLDILLEKIEEAGASQQPMMTAGNIPYLPLLLAQLRCVAHSHCDVIYTRIKDIFESATESAKSDLIASAEAIIDASKHDEFVQMLLDSTPTSKSLFSPGTIHMLTDFYLNDKMLSKLRCKVLAFITENQCPSEVLPLLVKFLLKILNEDSDDAVRQLVSTVREILIHHNFEKHDESNKQQLELFRYIQLGLTRSKKFYNIWQRTIASLPPIQFRAVDFLVLMILMHVREDNFLVIENIIRRRIKLEHITVSILHEAKEKYSAVLEEYRNVLIQILHDFLREKHKTVATFARSAYSVIFRICDTMQKTVIKQLLELTCNNSVNNMTNLALELLKELQQKYATDIQNWGMLMIPLLDRLSDMSIAQTRLVMEILCSIAYPAPNLDECETLQEQIDMIVKKQLINRMPFVKKQGIIGSVQLIDNIARISDSSLDISDLNVTYESVENLPEGRGKTAANYVVRVESATMFCPESMALFYDELASVCAAAPSDRANNGFFDKAFLIWFCEQVTFTFQKNFITEQPVESMLNIKLANQKCINSIDDTNTEDRESESLSIAINISELILKPEAEAAASILVLAPLFNLMRVLHLQVNEGSLEQINALLGAAITLPIFFDNPNNNTIFCDYDEAIQKKILDIFFHTVNWLRETVSSFATQKEQRIRNKVLKRLAELIDIESKVRDLLGNAPTDYVAPMAQFTSDQAITKQDGRSRQLDAARKQKATTARCQPPNQIESEATAITLNESKANTTNAGEFTLKLGGMGKQKMSKKVINFDQLYGPREVYRQMGVEVMLVLREDLVLEYPLPADSVGKHIGLPEFRFILTDLVSKLEAVVGAQKILSEPTPQHIAKPQYFMSDVSKFLTKITLNMDKISKAIDEMLLQVNQLHSHADLFTVEFNYLKVCFGLCIRVLALYFAWIEFEDDTKEELLRDSCIAILKSENIKIKRSAKTSTLAADMFKKCLSYEHRILELKTAVNLCHLLQALKRYSNRDNQRLFVEEQANEIRELCKAFFVRKWYHYNGTTERGAACNACLDILVKGYLHNSDFAYQTEIVQIVFEESKQLTGKDGILRSYPNIKKANFPLLFRTLCEVLINTLTDQIIADAAESLSEKLTMWERSCQLLNTLLDIIKAVDIPRNFQLFLKYSHLYLKAALQHLLPFLEKCIRRDPERVSKLLKLLQITTRFLHNLCCHSKALKNTAIISQVPALRETVENLVFRVKALLAANKCASVFEMNNLLNKDLQGDEILSQTGTFRSTGNVESDEEIPEDDASADETTISTRQGHSSAVNSSARRSKSSSRSKCF